LSRVAEAAVILDIEQLPAVTTPAEAAVPDAPTLYDDVPGNLIFDFHFDDTAQVTKAFARAAHVSRLNMSNTG